MNPRSLTKPLASVAAALLAVSPTAVHAQNRSETTLLVYSEKDRMRATEAIFNLTRQLKNDFTLNLAITYDGLTGASPTGASPSKQPQTITRPSGGGVIVLDAGEYPRDDGFKDRRFSIDAAVSRPVSNSITLTGGLRLSSEYDYSSVGVNAAVEKRFDNNRTRIGLSGAVSRDIIKPINGTPTPFEDITTEIDNDELFYSPEKKRKVTSDVVLSVTRFLSPETVVRVNYALSVADGYLTDPYKIISVVQSIDSTDPGEPARSLYEHRPDNRTGHALYGQIKRSTPLGVPDVSYRFYFDNWGITSHTVTLSWRVDFRSVGAFQPMTRWYTQTRADFSRPFLIQGQPLPDYATADSRFMTFDAFTYGMTYDVPVSPHSRLSLSMEWYTQRGDTSPPESFGPLREFDLFPPLEAYMLRIGLSHDF